MKDIKQVTVGSLFAGIGGFCLGFQEAGAKILWANEIDKNARLSYANNFKQTTLYPVSIKSLSVAKKEIKPVDILTAGFPCQPFSIAGNRKGFKDPRGKLFYEIIRLVKEFGSNKPKILILENVRTFKSHNEGKTFKKAIKKIQNLGYWFDENNAAVLNTKIHTQIPQNRERLFMVALSKDYFDLNTFIFPEEEKEKLNIFDFIDKGKQDDIYYIHETSQYYNIFKEAIEKGPKDTFYQLRRIYVRENKSKTCPTLTANMGGGGHNVPVIKDDFGMRKLTPLECARFQGFTEERFSFPVNIANTHKYKQIGNAVTVDLVIKIAKICIELLQTLNTNGQYNIAM